MKTFESIDLNDIDPKVAHDILISAVTPRPVALVTTQGENGVMNGAPYSYFNLASIRPAMVSVAITRNEDAIKDTVKHIRDSKVFVVNMVDEDNVKAVHKTASALSIDESELEKYGLTPTFSSTVKAPGIEEAKIRLECELKHIIPLEHRGTVTADLVLGVIKVIHIDKTILSNGEIDSGKLKAVGRLGGTDYTKASKDISIEEDE